MAVAVVCSLLVLLLLAALIAVLVLRRRRQQQQGYCSNMFGGGKKASKNGTGGGGNNNGPVYVYNDGSSHAALADKNNHQQPLATPTAQDILLSSELDDAERRKFDELEEEERYDQFGPGGGVGGPILQLRPPRDQDEMMGDYLDDDMESQRDGSVISRTAVYV